MESVIDHYYELAGHVVTQVSSFLKKNFKETKPITEIERDFTKHYTIKEDQQAHQIYENFFRTNTPEVAIYSEEGERDLNADYVWVIDPLDGSSNYSVGIPLFVTQLSLLFKSEPVASIISLPSQNLIFSAQKNKGSYCGSKKVSVSTQTSLKKAMVGIIKGTDNCEMGKLITNFGGITRTIRIYGSAGITLAYLSQGSLDVVVGTGAQLYDYLPGALLIREAGGVVKNFKGEEWKIDDKELIGTNSKLLPNILTAI